MSEKDLIKKETQQQVPGFGVSGNVMCPYSFMGPKSCMKGGCELWVELDYSGQKVGRCSLAWGAILKVETRVELSKINSLLEKIYKQGKSEK